MKLNGDYVADMAELHLGRIFAAFFFIVLSKMTQETTQGKNIYFV